MSVRWRPPRGPLPGAVGQTLQSLENWLRTRTSAPANESLDASELVIWLDPTPGAAKVMFKAKNSAGTVVTASLNLT